MNLKYFFTEIIFSFFILLLNFSTCFADVQLGDKGEEVEEIQRLLIEKNFLTGEADGIFGEATENALKDFQKSSGLEADGICGAETLKILRGENNSSVSSENFLKIGDSGEKVSELQNILIKLYYLEGIADGIFGAATEDALKNFQSENNLTADGICGAETFEILEKVLSGENSDSENFSSETSNNLTKPEEVLQFGSQGYAVRELQDMLIGLGYLTGVADGDFGKATENALKDFQFSVGLSATGIYDDATFNLLNDPETLSKGTIPQDAGIANVGDIIKPGMHGEGVENVQRLLIERGFLDGEADGWCGAATVAAIRDFQYSVGLAADGICGISTYAALENVQYQNEDSEWEKAVENFPKFKKTIYVDATAYSPDDPTLVGNKTASGTSVRRGIIAVDPAVIPLGTKVYIPGYGEAIAEDTGGDIKGNRIDIAFDTYDEAINFGRQSLQIYIIED